MTVFAISLKALEPYVQYLVVLGFFCEVQQFPCLYSPLHPPCKQTLFLRLAYQELHICSCCFSACSTVHWFQRSLSPHLLLCWCTQFMCSEYCSLFAACCIGSNVTELSSLSICLRCLLIHLQKLGTFAVSDGVVFSCLCHNHTLMITHTWTLHLLIMHTDN